MSILLSQADTKAIVNFHFKSLQGMYFSEYIPCNGYVLLFSDLVKDSYYNYIAQPTRDLKEVIADARPMFEERNRKLAIYVTPYSNVYGDEKLLPNSFKQWAADAWMVFDDPNIIKKHQIPKGIVIEPVSYEEKDEYVKIFNAAYSSDNPEDPYSNLPEYYGQSLRHSFDIDHKEYSVEYVWAKINGNPVGVAAMLSNSKVAGIYGVGTIKRYRKHGIGTSITAFLAKQATERQIPIIMLQTESGSKVEQWYLNIGFKTMFVAKYYIEL